jgi:periplasmic divalent cation tolerance protein
MKKFILIITTFPVKKDAQKICQLLISKSLAACCQIVGPIESHYTWQNRVEVSREYMCLIKTIKSRYKSVETIIKKNHSYIVPEIITLDITSGYKPYLDWIQKSVK